MRMRADHLLKFSDVAVGRNVCFGNRWYEGFRRFGAGVQSSASRLNSSKLLYRVRKASYELCSFKLVWCTGLCMFVNAVGFETLFQ